VKLRIASVVAIVALSVAPSASADGGTPIRSKFALANHCFGLSSQANGKFVATDADGYRAVASEKAGAAAFFFKATGLGTYMLYDQDGKLAVGREPPSGSPDPVTRADVASKPAEWAPRLKSGRRLAFRSTAGGRWLSVQPGTGALILTAARSRYGLFKLAADRNCRRYPEAHVGASGTPFKGTNPDGTVFGYADMHLHVTADLRAGGRVIHGSSFDPFGITVALGGDENDHGPDGSLDVTGNLLRTGLPFGTHDTHGWPSFAGWPTHDTNTHQQTYYVWLKRAWESGERFVVAQTIEDTPICEIEPLRSHSCDETQTIKLEIERLHQLEDYVDAQSGGPGRGWFRLVRTPKQARRVIERGKLAVMIGIESSNLFGCSEYQDQPQCDRADIDRGIRMYRRLGVRSVFVAHWTDNALSGAALEGGAKGTFINVFNRLQTGHYIRTEPCPEAGQGEEPQSLGPGELRVLAGFFPVTAPLADEVFPTYPPGPQCNSKGLTALGAFAIRRLIAAHMLIEVDHMSEKARDRVLEIAKAHHYPLVSSHNGTGGRWTPSELKRLYALGGLAAATPETAPELAAKIRALRPYRSSKYYFGVGLGTDTGGFADQPAPRADAAQAPLRYPFRSYVCKLKFKRQRTGERTYDLNADGVAHYGLIADLLADVQRGEGGKPAMRSLFRSAEAYLQMWQRAYAHR
jgi:microsomal dipeptidase-like Zn-dependent dipeptidase